ncbi:hypothetical protein ACQPX6_21965 [Actinomycetospora sp. CA-101289]|uniref:hypothetical protein n=1 Tax=Actinomycetospora sp. CA-101289 TaxID=3239893 RepID=UPI003D98D86F
MPDRAGHLLLVVTLLRIVEERRRRGEEAAGPTDVELLAGNRGLLREQAGGAHADQER